MSKEKSKPPESRAIKVIKIVTTIVYYCIWALSIIGILAVLLWSVASIIRDHILKNAASITLVIQPGDEVISEDVHPGHTVNGKAVTIITYRFSDGTTYAVWDTDILRNAQDEYERATISQIRGTTVKRWHDVTSDGINCITYKLDATAVCTLPDGHTVRYDQIIRVTDDDVNARIDTLYAKIKMYGTLMVITFFLDLIVIGVYVTLVIIGAVIEKTEREKRTGVKILRKGEYKVMPPKKHRPERHDERFDDEVYFEDGSNEPKRHNGFPV